MKSLPTNPSHDAALLEKLVQPGVLGIFNHVEATSVLANHKPTNRTINVLTHLVTVEGTRLKTSPEKILRIKFSKLSEWSFGIAQHSMPLDALPAKLDDAVKNERWAEEQGCLRFGTLCFQGHWFLPPAGSFPVAPVNRLVKNNFWNGSHLWEWTAEDKSDFLPFFEKPPLLQALSEGVAEHLPIQLASLSDKLGSLILQIPVTCITSDYRGTGHSDGGIICDVNWRPDIIPRPVIITAEQWYDGQMIQVSASLAGGGQVALPAQDGPAAVRPVIRDQEYDVLLGAMEVNIISSINVGIHVMRPEHRTFILKSRDVEEISTESIEVTASQDSVVGDPNRLPHFDDTRKRIYSEEMRGLRDRREFVQYRHDDKDEVGAILGPKERHRRALKDIHYLIHCHGRKAVWLWDPFLNATEVINTLFYNTCSGADMRALTGGKQAQKNEKGSEMTADHELTKKQCFILEERNILDQCSGNCEGLQLEFRAKSGTAGFDFHDRFLIFPHAKREPLAWSLGISVNGLGKEHHILQKVPNGRLIADAFQELWDDLDQPENLVWKTP